MGLCAVADAQRASVWHALIRRMTGSQPGSRKKDHGCLNRYVCAVDGDNAPRFSEMESVGFMIRGASDTPFQQTYHATPAACRWAGLHPAAVTRATGAQPLPITGGRIDALG